jgi:hypothetical protein
MDRRSASAFPALPLWPLPLACAGLFLLAIHLSYLIAAAHGHVSWCLPYWLDCTSISATGRQLPEKLVFKPLLTVAAMGLMAYWFLMGRWLRLQGVTGRRPRTVALLGSIGGLCLIFYTASLGEGGETALVLRRLGAVLGFSLNYLAQLLLTAELRRGEVPAVLGDNTTVRYLWWLVVGMLMLGMLSALTGSFPVHDRIDDGVEWILALMLNVHVALTARLWRKTEFSLELMLQ